MVEHGEVAESGASDDAGTAGRYGNGGGIIDAAANGLPVRKIDVDSDDYGSSRDRAQDRVRKTVTYVMVGLFAAVELGRLAAAIGAMRWAHGTWADVQGEIGNVSTQVIAVVGVVIGFYFGQQSKASDE